MTVWLAAAAVGATVLAGPWSSPVLSGVRSLLPGNTLLEQAGADSGVPPSAGQAQAGVDAALAKLVAGRPQDSVSLAALDTTTGVQVAWHGDAPMTAASVFKLALLESYLLHDQDQGVDPGTGAPGALAAMIQRSDNDAADQVYLALRGAAGLRASLPRLGVTATRLGADGQWGLSTTTAADQLALLTNLVSAHSPLSPASRAYALRLMSNVEDDQRWGVSAARDPDTDFANKNGWLQVDSDGDRWAIGSVGVLEVGGHQVLLAVLSQHGADEADGVGLVESVSRAVATALNPGRTHRGG